MLTAVRLAMAATVPGARIVPNESSRLMRAVGWFFRVTRINPRFAEYVTVVGRTVYAPGELLDDPARAWPVVGHELVHLLRAWHWRLRDMATWLPPAQLPLPPPVEGSRARLIGWSLAYLLPQSAALALFVASLATLAFTGLGAGILLGCAAIALCPWPAPFRLREEAEAYVVSIAAASIAGGNRDVGGIVDQLAGWPYYRAAWSRGAATEALSRALAYPSAETSHVVERLRAMWAESAS